MVTIYLVPESLQVSNDLPAVNRFGQNLPQRLIRDFRCLVLLRVRFSIPLMLPPERCALTAPFHHCSAHKLCAGLCIFCGTFSSSPYGLEAPVRRHPVLWSPDFPLPRYYIGGTVTHLPFLKPVNPRGISIFF